MSLTLMYGSAFAACNASSGTISTNCTDLILPQTPPGNAAYTISDGTTITNTPNFPGPGSDKAVRVNTAPIMAFTNNGTISAGSDAYAIRMYGAQISGGILNTGTIIANSSYAIDGIRINNDYGLNVASRITGGITNAGTISSKGLHALHIDSNNYVDFINNQSGKQITTSNKGTYALDIAGRVDKIYNAGTISTNQTSSNIDPNETSNSTIKLFTPGSIGEIINSGEISVLGTLNPSAAIDTEIGTSVGSITNTGNIYSVNSYGINNQGTLTTLNNYQGATGSGGQAITYAGNLPTFYNIIAYGDKYGQLAVALNSHSGQLTFGLFSGDSTNGIAPTKLNAQNYVNVMSGLNAADITNANTKVYTFGKHASLWLRPQTASTTTWDLVLESDRISTQFLGYDDPNVVNTYTAMNSNRQATEGILHQRYALLNALMQYDCNRFDKYGVCIQFQTRATGYGTQATGSGILNASYRFADKFRVGAYLDYQAFQGNPFGMYLGTGGVQQNNNNPSFGGYVGYSQNSDETGVQARASGGYNPGQVSVLRAVLAGTEPGYGNAGLNAYYAYGVAGYGVKIADGLVVTPYGGIQYTDVTRNGYTEQASLFLTIYPLAYNSYYERLITGLFGAKAKGMLTDKLGYQLSLGAQVDFTRSANSYSGYSYVPGMEIYGIAHGGGWNGVRPAGMAGVFYDPLPNHRVSLNAYTSQQAWTARTYTTGLLGYQIAF